MAFTRIGGSWANEYVALSTDEKYTKATHPDVLVPNGSSCLEIDTGDIYLYDSENDQWCVVTIGEGGGGSGGTTNYNNLNYKPKINGVELSGNKTTEDLHLAATAGTIEFDDSETYAAGSIGAEVSNVKNAISQLDASKAPIIINTASGDIASFADGADGMQICKIVGTIVPVQDLHGQSAPYPAGGGINLLNPDATTDNMRLNVDGRLIAGNGWCVSDWIPVTENTDYFANNVIASSGGYCMCFYDANKSFLRYTSVYGGGNTVKNSGADAAYLRATILLSKKAESIVAQSSSYLPFSPYANICPISGWNGANIYNEETYDTSATPKLNINWQSSAGIIYGGSFTLNEDGSADVVSEYKLMTFDGSFDEGWAIETLTSGVNFYIVRPSDMISGMGSDVIYGMRSNMLNSFRVNREATANNVTVTSGYINFVIAEMIGVSTLPDYLTWLSNNNLQWMYKLGTPLTYHFSDIGELYTYLGTNNVWIDTGSITECDYPADTKLYVDGLTAPDEDMIANANIASGKYFIVNNQLYLSTAAIAAGASIVPGTNCTATNLAEALNALNT